MQEKIFEFEKSIKNLIWGKNLEFEKKSKKNLIWGKFLNSKKICLVNKRNIKNTTLEKHCSFEKIYKKFDLKKIFHLKKSIYL